MDEVLRVGVIGGMRMEDDVGWSIRTSSGPVVAGGSRSSELSMLVMDGNRSGAVAAVPEDDADTGAG